MAGTERDISSISTTCFKSCASVLEPPATQVSTTVWYVSCLACTDTKKEEVASLHCVIFMV